MALFYTSFDATMDHEGGYVHDPDDVGGETYRGISRRYNPSWDGWSTIDSAKSAPNFPNSLRIYETLNSQVKNFYKVNYWDRFEGDQIISQNIANELFDTAVNMGMSRAVKFLQIGLNLLNRNQTNYADIVEDGKFGPATMNALTSYSYMDNEVYLLKVLNILQGMHYINYMTKSPTQEKYALGWLKRVII